MYLQIQLQKPSYALMKLVLVRTGSGMDHQEILPLLHYSYQPQKLPIRVTHIITSQSSAADISQHQLFGGEYGNQAFILELFKETTTEGDQQQEENCWGQVTQGMDIRECKYVCWSNVRAI